MKDDTNQQTTNIVITDYDILAAMRTYGGSFVKAYAAAYLAADSGNAKRLREAFPDLWNKYTTIASHDKATKKGDMTDV